jgi:CMP-N-acetylneuraminic acid synthetase
VFKDNKVLCVIPARGGSKGIPKKNLQEIGGRSLVEWALNTAQQCSLLDRIIVSSDSQEIIQQANKHGKYAPFVRPGELARDNSPSLPVFQYGLKWAETEDSCTYDYVVVLEPTCPFRLPKHIEEGLAIAVASTGSSVMSVVEVGDQHPVRIKKLHKDGKIAPFCIPEPEGLRRQDQEPAFIRNGAVLVFPRHTIVSNRLWGDTPYGFRMDNELYSINIDESVDIVTASYLFERLKKEGKLHLIDASNLI